MLQVLMNSKGSDENFENIGEIREKRNIYWSLHSINLGHAQPYTSPSFFFADNSWRLQLCMNGSKSKYPEKIGLYLRRNSPGPSVNVKYSLGMKTKFLKTKPNYTFTNVFEMAGTKYGTSKFLSKYKLCSYIEDKREHNEVFTIICALMYKKSTENAGLEKLSKDFKEMMESGDHSDVTFKVGEENFLLHRNILSARSPFFRAMFQCEMKEKVTGIVSIDDCNPDIFRSFIHFLYTGKIDRLTSENVCELYKEADKYQEDQLKKECLQFMLNTITIDNFWDFIILALMHCEATFLESVTEFFCKNAKEIMRSVKWHTFLKEYPTEANELYFKALDYSGCDFIIKKPIIN